MPPSPAFKAAHPAVKKVASDTEWIGSTSPLQELETSSSSYATTAMVSDPSLRLGILEVRIDFYRELPEEF
jgi:hypothetical protein